MPTCQGVLVVSRGFPQPPHSQPTHTWASWRPLPTESSSYSQVSFSTHFSLLEAILASGTVLPTVEAPLVPRLSNAVILPTLSSSQEFSGRIRRVLPERVFLWRLWTRNLNPNRNAASLLTGCLPGLSRLGHGSTRMTRDSSSPKLSQTSEVVPSWDSCI